MALLQYFKFKKQKEHLPDPNGPLGQKIPSSKISSANACVCKLQVFDSNAHSEGNSSTTSQSWGCSTHSVNTSSKILNGRKASEIGTTATIWHYAKRYPNISLTNHSLKI